MPHFHHNRPDHTLHLRAGSRLLLASGPKAKAAAKAAKAKAAAMAAKAKAKAKSASQKAASTARNAAQTHGIPSMPKTNMIPV